MNRRLAPPQSGRKQGRAEVSLTKTILGLFVGAGGLSVSFDSNLYLRPKLEAYFFAICIRQRIVDAYLSIEVICSDYCDLRFVRFSRN